MAGEFRAKTLEFVYEVDSPKGVTWLTGHSFDFDGHPDYQPNQDPGTTCDGCNRWGVFPVSTAELLGVKGTWLAIGDVFGVEANLGASSPADVKPLILEFKSPVSDDEFAAWCEGK